MHILYRTLFIIILTTILTACANRPTSDTSDPKTLSKAPEHQTQKTMAGHFAGTLPCADCSGWDTQLELTNDAKFTLSMHSLDEHESEVFQTTGTWSLDDGPIPFIMLKTTDSTEEPRYYEVISHDRLNFVGFEKERIETELDYSLTRVDTP